MPIWFAYRSPYDGPLSKHVKRLDGAETLLGWFRSIWRAIPDSKKASAYTKKLLGTKVYCFASLFQRIAEDNLAAPATVAELHGILQNVFYLGGGEYRGTDDTIQIATDDDDFGLAMYWFTDTFAQAHPERVAYLLHDDWQLPQTLGPGGFTPQPGLARVGTPGTGAGAVYVLQYDLCNYDEFDDRVPAEVVQGRRLADLVPWLLGLNEKEAGELSCTPLYCLHGPLLALLGEGDGLEASFRQALKDDPTDRATWNAYTDWLAEQELPRAELYLLDLAAQREAGSEDESGEPPRVQVGPHSLAIVLRRREKYFEQWYLFDDVWASGNENLANALLDAAARFNVLDAYDVRSEYSPGIPAGEER